MGRGEHSGRESTAGQEHNRGGEDNRMGAQQDRSTVGRGEHSRSRGTHKEGSTVRGRAQWKGNTTGWEHRRSREVQWEGHSGKRGAQ